MTGLKYWGLAAMVALFGASTVNAHAHVPTAEEVMSFRDAASTLTVINTHRRGILGGELIEIRDEDGDLKTSWWSARGWCFTAHAIDNHPCWYPSGYVALYKSRMARNAASPLDRDFSGWKRPVSTDFCDHYSQLEYTVSGDTSGKCGHQNGLALPSWAE